MHRLTHSRILWITLLFALIVPLQSASAQTINAATDFTYQGYIEQNGSPVSGSCNFQFSLFDAPGTGSQIGTTQTLTGVSVNNGVFSVTLDFGESAFNGVDHWLAISADCDGGGYVPLTPRQPITPAPYALGMYGMRTEPNTTSPNVIGGFIGNFLPTGIVGATISGGGEVDSINSVWDNFGTVGGGAWNTVGVDNGDYSLEDYATVGGGLGNNAINNSATVGGGESNVASGVGSTVGGGTLNYATGFFGTVGGGGGNRAVGAYSTIPGGTANRASGENSFAAGNRAQATHAYSFVWAGSDVGVNSNTTSFADGSFTVRAFGGVRFYSTNSGTTTGVQLLAGTGAWATLSDRNSKDNFQSIDTVSVLNRLMSVPVGTWNYIEETGGVRHIGPVAQDFYAAFNVGADERYITTVDADGVALAAIQGLYQVMQAENDTLKIGLLVLGMIVIGLGVTLGAVIVHQNRRITKLSLK